MKCTFASRTKDHWFDSQAGYKFLGIITSKIVCQAAFVQNKAILPGQDLLTFYLALEW
jgi:hypothetical protein